MMKEIEALEERMRRRSSIEGWDQEEYSRLVSMLMKKSRREKRGHKVLE